MVLSVAVALGVSLVVTRFCRDLGLNLVADSISILFAIFILERFREKLEKDRLSKVYFAMYISAMSIKSELFQTIEYLATSTLADTDRTLIAEAASGDKDSLIKILLRVPYHQIVEYWPAAISDERYDSERRWGDFSRDRMNVIAKKSSEFLSQYAQYAEPALIEALSTFQPAKGGFYSEIGKAPLRYVHAAEWTRVLEADRVLGSELRRLYVDAKIDPKTHILPPEALNITTYLLTNFDVTLSSREVLTGRLFPEATRRQPFFPGMYAAGSRP